MLVQSPTSRSFRTHGSVENGKLTQSFLVLMGCIYPLNHVRWRKSKHQSDNDGERGNCLQSQQSLRLVHKGETKPEKDTDLPPCTPEPTSHPILHVIVVIVPEGTFGPSFFNIGIRH